MLDLADIQGNILRGYSFRHARLLFLKLPAGAAGREVLADLTAQVTSAAPWGRDDRPSFAVNVAVTDAGLAALGVPAPVRSTFPEEFREGMAARASSLRDVAADQVQNWDDGWRRWESIHLLVSAYGDDGHALRRSRDQLVDRVRAAGGDLVVEEEGARLGPAGAPSTEHFGFVDGLSQPWLRAMADIDPGGAQGRQVLATGEVLLGHEDGEGFESVHPEPGVLGRNGTFLVFRKLRQDVDAFRRLCAEHGARYPGGPEEFAAKLMGRWPDGRPLAAEAGGGEPTFEDDRDGGRCPVGAHVRRVNPRRGFGADRQPFFDRHRMLRRGIPYGPAAGDGPAGGDRGLLFMCLCASIARQFEFVQGEWINDGNALGLADERDPVTASVHPAERRRMTIQGGPGRVPWLVAAVPRLVSVRGGAYFFVPSLGALRWLAGARDCEPGRVSLGVLP